MTERGRFMVVPEGWPEDAVAVALIDEDMADEDEPEISRLENHWSAVAALAENRANAQLIAAAPDMRDALGIASEVLALPTSDAGRERALAAVRAAIAKADGEGSASPERGGGR